MMGQAVIVANGSISDYSFYNDIFYDECDYIICADGAARHLKKYNILPDLLVGDFDSISNEDLEFYKSSGTEVVKFPVEKDMTDTELAVSSAQDRGYKKITIVGGLGTRADHSLSNVFLLVKMLKQGLSGRIIDENNEIIVIDKQVNIERKKDFKITLLSLSKEVTGVNTQGLYYTLKDATLVMGSSYGVSNEFISDIAQISIKSGLLMIILSKD